MNLAEYTGAASSASTLAPGAARLQLDPKEIQRLDRQDRLFTRPDEEDSCALPQRSSNSFNQTSAGSATAALNPAAAAKAAAAKFGMPPAAALGRRSSVVKTSESMQPVGNAAQLVAKQRRSSVTMPDSVTQGDIMSR